MPKVRIRQEAWEVQVIVDGKMVINAPWNVALDIAREITAKARQAEEYAKAENIVFDNALLIRSGAPFGLSNNKNIVTESLKEAAHNYTLRRRMAGGIKSTSIVGTPAIRKE